MKAVIFLLLLPACFALVDPPVMDVSGHDMGMARNGTMHVNAYGLPERTPTLDDPSYFAYAKVLTLSPSVNRTVFPSMHPWLVWLTTERHAGVVTEDSREGDCSGALTTRRFDPVAATDSIVADYSLDGVDGTPASVHRSMEIDANPAEVPFKEEMPLVSSFTTSVVNFTNRSVVVKAPSLNITLRWRFHINYTQEETVWHRTEKGDCLSETAETNGSVQYSAGDSASYAVQNNRTAVIPLHPAFLSLDADTTLDPSYELGFLSDGPLYKYYLLMDGRVAGACYFYDFSVVNDSYGVQEIIASPAHIVGLSPGDPQAAYAGGHRTVECKSGSALLDASPFTNQSHNFSDAYYFQDVFRDLAPGDHHAELWFYGWDGRAASAHSDITAKGETALSVGAYASGGWIVADCRLASGGSPLPGRPVELEALGQKKIAITDGDGTCSARFSTDKALAGVSARFGGDAGYLPSYASTAVLGLPMPEPGGSLLAMTAFGALALFFGRFATGGKAGRTGARWHPPR